MVNYFQFKAELVNVSTPREVEVPGWEIGISRNISDYIYPNSDTTILSPKNLCSANPDILLMVISAAHHFDMRQTIREKWANKTVLESLNHTNVKMAFILGQSKNETVNVSFIYGVKNKKKCNSINKKY